MKSSQFEVSILRLSERLRAAHDAGDIVLASELRAAEPGTRLDDWLAEFERVLAQLLEVKQQHRSFQQRFSELLEFACLLASLDFSSRLAVHGEYDEMDAVCLALNMLGEELQASTLSRDQVQDIFNAIPDSIIVIDPRGDIELANSATGRMFGCDPSFLFERALSEVLAIPSAHVDELVAEMSREPIRDREMVYPSLIHPAGVPVTLSAASINDAQGGIRAYVWVAKDITRRKELEYDLEKARDEALESSRLKGEFLANMSHEIRTPMNGIMGMLELLLDTELSRNQQELAKTAMDSANVLLNVLNDILDISKIEAGKLVFESLEFELQTVVDECIQLLAMRAQQKGLTLTGLVLSEAPLVVRGDPGRLRQVLLNLVTNAIKFTATGRVELRVSILADEVATTDRVRIRVEVEDTGIGIPPERQESIFGVFVQADGSTTRVHGGTGLGLAICRQIVHLMHGEIGVESNLGQGSTFWFTAEFERGNSHQGDGPQPHHVLHGVRTLLVDASDANRRIIEYYLEQWKMRWESQTSGRDALLRLRAAGRSSSEEPFGLVILDMQIPDVDGTLMAQFLAIDPEIPKLQVLLMTPVDHREAEEPARDGVDLYLTKPITRRGLRDTLMRLMTETRAERQSVRARARESRFFGGARVLIVEDNPINARVAIHQLEKLGCRVDLARNGIEAIAALDESAYELIFMDCQMPLMDGYEAVREIRARPDDTASIPIVAMTAHALEGERERCLAVGMSDYLAKPFTRAGLVAVLKRWLSEGSSPSIPLLG